jgi:phosphonatase-like hydrolase
MATPPGFAPEQIRLVLFDLAGTTVKDDAGGASLVVTTMVETFREAGLSLTPAAVAAHRGRDKREVIQRLLEANPPAPTQRLLAEPEQLLARFLARLDEHVHELQEIPGSAATFAFLQARGVRVGVGSGFPLDLVQRIVARMGWLQRKLIDYVESTETFGAGRPAPLMIQDAMRSFGLGDARAVIKVGDTPVDIEEGRNAGVWTVAVTTGSQSLETLQAYRPDFLLTSVAELPDLLH